MLKRNPFTKKADRKARKDAREQVRSDKRQARVDAKAAELEPFADAATTDEIKAAGERASTVSAAWLILAAVAFAVFVDAGIPFIVGAIVDPDTTSTTFVIVFCAPTSYRRR